MAIAIIKVVLFWVVFWAVFLALQSVTAIPLGRIGPMLAAIIASVAAFLTIVALLRTDGGTLSQVGLGYSSRWTAEFLVGLVVGTIVTVAMIGVVILTTPVQITAVPDVNVAKVLAMAALVFFLLGLMEELVFRSYPLFKLRHAIGVRPAIYISSIAFAFYHGLDLGNLLGPGVWGLLFGWMAFKTNSIALPTGVHVALNWVQALVGEKSRYSDAIWELSLDPNGGVVAVETPGLVMQIMLLILGVVLVERLARQQGTTDR